MKYFLVVSWIFIKKFWRKICTKSSLNDSVATAIHLIAFCPRIKLLPDDSWTKPALSYSGNLIYIIPQPIVLRTELCINFFWMYKCQVLWFVHEISQKKLFCMHGVSETVWGTRVWNHLNYEEVTNVYIFGYKFAPTAGSMLKNRENLT